MNGVLKTLMLSLIFALLCVCHAAAQLSFGGTPHGLPDFFETQRISGPDLEEVREEDRANPDMNRFAVPVEAHLAITEFSWIPSPGGRIGYLAIECPGAQSLALQMSAFSLPKGGSMFVYRPDGLQVLGAYTESNNRGDKGFLAGFIDGDVAIVEIFEPFHSLGQTKLEISRLLYAYEATNTPTAHPFQVYQGGRGFGDALQCHVNVNCPEAADWQEEKTGIVRILRVFEEGAGWCSGSLINNTANDGRPLVLSAFHCQQGLTPIYELWRFDFAFEFPGCTSDTVAPPFWSLLGTQPLAMRQETDFLLFELDSPIPLLFGARFNGWNRSSSHVPSQSAILHHPFGDVKKYSADEDEAIIFPSPINWSNNVTTPANHHFRAILDEGTIESGSSGGPLFDELGLVVGQLHGGQASCDQFVTYHGRLTISWDGGDQPQNRLKDWLDPADSGVLQLDPLQSPDFIDTLAGMVETINGDPIGLATVVLTGPDGADSVVTDATGIFAFYDVPVGEGYTLAVHKDINPRNGVSTFDLLRIQQHILKINPFQYVWEYLATDVTSDGAITLFDMLQLQRVILLLVQQMPGLPSWQFFPETVQTDLLPVNTPDVRLTGIKTGDLTGDADPLK